MIAVVWNGAAGGCSALDAEDVRARIAAATGHDVVLVEVGDARDPARCANEAIAQSPDMLVAAGGDGTVSCCASALIAIGASDRIALGMLPLGTSSSFARALDIPVELDAAIENLARDERRTLDVAVVSRGDERRTMILHCMVGLHAETIAETSTESKQRWGALAYAATALRKLASLEPFAVEIATDHHVIRCRAIAVAAANLAPPRTVLAHGPSHLLADDGRVDVTLVAAETLAEAIATGIHLYRTGRDHEPATRDNVGSFSAVRVVIETSPPQLVLVDGEPFGTTPITIDTLSRALVVVAPPAAEASGDPIDAPLLGLPDLEISKRI